LEEVVEMEEIVVLEMEATGAILNMVTVATAVMVAIVILDTVEMVVMVVMEETVLKSFIKEL
jgi:hypothetical protein